jgi:hypothetical protein
MQHTRIPNANLKYEFGNEMKIECYFPSDTKTWQYTTTQHANKSHNNAQ